MAAGKDINLVFVTLLADSTGMRAMHSTRKPMLKFRRAVRKAATAEIQISLDEKFINQYLQLIKSLPKRMQKRVLSAALSFAATPVRAAAKRNVMSESKTVADSISKGVMKRLSAGRAGIKVGTKRQKGSSQDPWFAHFIEFGTSPHSLGGGREHPGTPSKSFMRTAFDKNKKAMLERIASRLGFAVDREINRVLKRGKI